MQIIFRITNHKKQRLAHNKVSIYLQVHWFFKPKILSFHGYTFK